MELREAINGLLGRRNERKRQNMHLKKFRPWKPLKTWVQGKHIWD